MMARPTLIFSLGVLRLKAVQVAWASRPLDRALGHETVTTYEATTSGTAYGGHGNAADEWTDGARARPTILLPRGNSGPERVNREGHARRAIFQIASTLRSASPALGDRSRGHTEWVGGA